MAITTICTRLCPDPVHAAGPGRALRRVLQRWGVSAEFEPRALSHAPEGDNNRIRNNDDNTNDNSNNT